MQDRFVIINAQIVTPEGVAVLPAAGGDGRIAEIADGGLNPPASSTPPATIFSRLYRYPFRCHRKRHRAPPHHLFPVDIAVYELIKIAACGITTMYHFAVLCRA